jgi:hypothetical protein
VTNEALCVAAALMLDFADGKVKRVDVRPLICGCNEQWYRYGTRACKYPLWDWHRNEYRAAPEPQYRPYTRAEMIDLIGKRVLKKCGGSRRLVLGFHAGQNFANCDLLDDTGWGTERLSCSSEDLLAGWTHLDGSPCGVEVEDDA